ncbi:4098_t:CDS:2 [Racocetra fulgida]|uniref:4098_t:CDS:1 n=1 Tax=Racocetra fulgida TaxID=60492 RepID=A0A9N8VT62_9GLOM|nr:4098_t:CDS:2 [Racocetra fulgida]
MHPVNNIKAVKENGSPCNGNKVPYPTPRAVNPVPPTTKNPVEQEVLLLQEAASAITSNESRSNNCPRPSPDKSDQKRAEHPLDRVGRNITPRSETNDHVDMDKTQKQETKRLKNDHKKDTPYKREATSDLEDPLWDVQSLFGLDCDCESGISIRKDEL